MTNIKHFDASFLSINQIPIKSTDDVIYDIEYTTMKGLDSANSLYLVFDNANTYIKENNANKYLIFAFTYKNKKEKDFMKIKFKSDDNLPLGKKFNILVCIIAVGSVFQESSNYYPEVYLHECLYEYEYKDEDDSYSIV